MSNLRFALTAFFVLVAGMTVPTGAGAQGGGAAKQLRFEAMDAASTISTELNRARPALSGKASELKTQEIRKRSAKLNGMLFRLASVRTDRASDIEKARYMMGEVIAELERIRFLALEGPGVVSLDQDAIESALLRLLDSFEQEERAAFGEP